MLQDHAEAIPDAAANTDGNAEAAAMVARIDAELRANLGRRLVVALVLADAPPSADVQAAVQRLRHEVAAYNEVWEPPSQRAAGSVEAALRNALTFDADAILVWADWSQATSISISEPAEQQPAQMLRPDQRAAIRAASYTAAARAVMTQAEQLGALDRSFVALIGPGVTRPTARALGYEDGFSSAGPTTALVETLAHEALARDEYRRKGSSPPCYL